VAVLATVLAATGCSDGSLIDDDEASAQAAPAGSSPPSAAVVAEGPVTTMDCPISGMEAVSASVLLGRVGDRITRFAFVMDRPVTSSDDDCQIFAERGDARSSWSDPGAVTRVAIHDASAPAGDRVISFTPRPGGARMGLGEPRCGTFPLPPEIDFEWNDRGCAGRAIGWLSNLPPGSVTDP
jgi:hypothetical protein